MRKENLAGISIFLMTLLSIASALSGLVSPLYVAAFAWFAFFILVRQLPRAMMIQVSAMISVGLVCLVMSRDSISFEVIVKLLSANHSLIAVIASVSFLRLITQPGDTAEEKLPVGKSAVLKTLWGLHLFSSVITLSAMMIFGNRIEKEAAIGKIHGIMFSRTFACGCFWSPFYVAMATALIYAPGSNLLALALAGLPIAVFGLAVSSWELSRNQDIDTTPGYPVHMDAMFVPLTLSILMVGAHLLFPEFPVLTLIAMLSLALSLAVLVFKQSSATGPMIKEHIVTELPRINRELSLFLGAGIMSTGIMLLITSSNFSLAIPDFKPSIGILFMLASIFVSIVGVHPIITISVVGSLLLNTSYEPNLLGICMMMMWGLGIVASPLSGINLAIQGRFGLSSFLIMRWNAPYVVTMLFFCTALLYFYTWSGVL